MLAKLVREVPTGHDMLFEPKWDGFRCIVERRDDNIELFSRTGRPLSRYFPELTLALREVDANSFVADGEIVATKKGVADFASLMARIHPSQSRVNLLAKETPASMMLFDLMRIGGQDLLD